MSDCADCRGLEQRVSGLVAALQQAQDANQLANVPHVDPRDRHWMRLSCDRCGASLLVASALAVCEAELRQSIGDLARRARWSMSRMTARELVLEADGERDLCPVCTLAGAR